MDKIQPSLNDIRVAEKTVEYCGKTIKKYLSLTKIKEAC